MRGRCDIICKEKDRAGLVGCNVGEIHFPPNQSKCIPLGIHLPGTFAKMYLSIELMQQFTRQKRYIRACFLRKVYFGRYISSQIRQNVSSKRYGVYYDRAKDQCDLVWLENLNLRGGFKKTIMDYIEAEHPDLLPLYHKIYIRKDRSYFENLERRAEEIAKKYDCRFVDNETPYERVPQGHPTIVDYFYHEEVRGTANSGKRNK